ncbi:MAG: DUF2145 domain-containing protein [Pseudomonadota bacterium]
MSRRMKNGVTESGRRLLRGLVLSCLFVSALSFAGQDCGERSAPTPQALARGLQLGEQVRDQLERSGASMAFVARVGLDLSEFNQHFTHMGVAVRDHVRNRWQVVHLFNPCGKSQSEIMAQPLEKFYEVDLFEYEALAMVPSLSRQALLRNAFLNPAKAKALHSPAYNMIAHPFETRFQNSNQWILEMIALGLDERQSVSNRPQAQTWLKAQAYEPGTIRISNMRRTGARLFSSHISFADHTQEEYENQRYLVVTVDSIIRLLAGLDPELKQLTLH